jgi:transposase
MNDMVTLLERWQLDAHSVRTRMYGASTPRERERWHAVWLLLHGWSASQVADALERDAHTIGNWVEVLRQHGPKGLVFEQSGGSPPPSQPSNRPN